MNNNVDMSHRNDIDQAAAFQEKVTIIADEVLIVLKELHQEHKKQINSKLIAEKMFYKESVKKVLRDNSSDEINGKNRLAPLNETVNMILDKFSELVPSSMTEDINGLMGKNHNKTITESSTDWLDAAIRNVQKYIHSLSNRGYELENLLQKATNYLTETEKYMASELSSVHEKFEEDRDFEKSISSNMSAMRPIFNGSSDINIIKKAIFSKIELINKNIEKKKEQDILKLKETERTLEEMSKKMSSLKHDAEAMRKRSEEAEIKSLYDNLTGLYNRKAYDRKIEETLANLERYNVPSCLLICDIDHFKRINDNFGHHIGDLTLKKVAQICKERVRKNDFMARYGGEEFVIILPHTRLEGAIKAGENIRSIIDRSIFSFKDKEVPVTTSVGVSAFRKGDNATTVFERADAALYLAKESGRNMVRTEDDVKSEST